MDNEKSKRILLEILSEAQELPAEDLEIVAEITKMPENGIDLTTSIITVPKGRAEEFKANAYFYYEDYKRQNNIFDVKSDEYLEQVYFMLMKEISQTKKEEETILNEKESEQNITEAYDIYTSNQSIITKIEQLTNSLKTIDERYQKIISQCEILESKNPKTPQDEEKINDLTAEMKIFNNSKIFVTNQLANLKHNVNEELISYINKQMADILNRAKSAKTTSTTIDNTMVLPSDVENYNNLLKLLNILNNLDYSLNLVLVAGSVYVNVLQKEEVEALLANNAVFSKIKNPQVKEDPREINKKFLVQIINRMNEIVRLSAQIDPNIKIANEYVAEYNNLSKLRTYLTDYQTEELAQEKIGNLVYVNRVDVANITNLIKSIPLFASEDLTVPKVEVNTSIIEELENYLKSLEKKVNQYHGVSGIPCALSNIGILVLKTDVEEYNNVYEIIKLLEDTTLSATPDSSDVLTEIWDIGKVKAKNILKFKQLARNIRYFSTKVPQIAENEEAYATIKGELTSLNDKAKNTPNPVLAPNGIVLESDLELYEALITKLKYLEASKDSADLVYTTDALIASEYAPMYEAACKKVTELLNPEIKSTPVLEEAIISPELKPESEPALIPASPASTPKITPTPVISEPVKIETQSEEGPKKPKPRGKRHHVQSVLPAKTPQQVEEHRLMRSLGLAFGINALGMSYLIPPLVYTNEITQNEIPELTPLNSILTKVNPVKEKSAIHALKTVYHGVASCFAKLTKSLSQSLTITEIKGEERREGEEAPEQSKASVMSQLKEFASSITSRFKKHPKPVFSTLPKPAPRISKPIALPDLDEALKHIGENLTPEEFASFNEDMQSSIDRLGGR